MGANISLNTVVKSTLFIFKTSNVLNSSHTMSMFGHYLIVQQNNQLDNCTQLKKTQIGALPTFSCTMDTKGRIIRASLFLHNNSFRISTSATSVFPPLVGREYTRLPPFWSEGSLRHLSCHSEIHTPYIPSSAFLWKNISDLYSATAFYSA